MDDLAGRDRHVHPYLERSRSAGESVSQMRTVKSPDPETRRVPSALNESVYT